MIGIYKYTNKYNRKVYVGKSSNIARRKTVHKCNAKSGISTYFYNALRKYGDEGFDFDLLIDLSWLKGHTKEEINKVLNYWERFYIRYYGSNIHDYGYNETEGGDGTIGYIFTEADTKKKVSIIK